VVAGKLSILAEHCAVIGRDYDTVLRTNGTGWTILAPDERSLDAKMAPYFPDGVERRYTGTWRHFVSGATRSRPSNTFAPCGQPAFSTLSWRRSTRRITETITLLAKEVVPRV
jgi:hypothetical protein